MKLFNQHFKTRLLKMMVAGERGSEVVLFHGDK
jgi:hypothetical protein